MPPPDRAAVRKFDSLIEQYKKPYTATEAARFMWAIRAGNFDKASHLAAGPKRNLGLAQGPRADEQQPDGLSKQDSKARGAALIGEALQKKFALNAKIMQSEAEHARAGGTMDVLFGLGRYVAFTTGCTFIPGPPKGWDGVIRKTMDFETELDKDTHENAVKKDKKGNPLKASQGYEGNYSQLKDEIRMTLVCTDLTMQKLVTKLVEEVVAQGQMDYAKRFTVTHAHLDTCGYSGVNGAIRTRTGEAGEVQINVPTVMFGKMSAKEYKGCLRTSDTDYESLQQRYGLPGGYGHALYEIWRTNKANPRGARAAELSKRYYDTLRAYPNVNARLTQVLANELKEYKQQPLNLPVFEHQAAALSSERKEYQSDYR